MIHVLGIETSCDETSASVVSDDKHIRSNVIFSQIEEHKPYLGVVPEIASRAHIKHLPGIIERALEESNLTLNDMDAIAVTSGPGLIGGVIVGVMMAKGIAHALRKPLLGINHLEGHALTARLTNDVVFPYMLLLVSGGHSQILHVRDVGDYRMLGSTLDDAVGESFDKVAKMLHIGFPGGPQVERLAKQGDAERFTFPRPMLYKQGCMMSFSGLKTAVKYQVDAIVRPTDQDKADICASFQAAVGDTLIAKLHDAFTQLDVPCSTLVIAGGVAANQYLNRRIHDAFMKKNIAVIAPPLKLCTDNAAMIAWAGVERMLRGALGQRDVCTPRARWSLETVTL